MKNRKPPDRRQKGSGSVPREENGVSWLIDAIIQALRKIDDPRKLKNIYFFVRHIA